jgi:hypothetical protein
MLEYGPVVLQQIIISQFCSVIHSRRRNTATDTAVVYNRGEAVGQRSVSLHTNVGYGIYKAPQKTNATTADYGNEVDLDSHSYVIPR